MFSYPYFPQEDKDSILAYSKIKLFFATRLRRSTFHATSFGKRFPNWFRLSVKSFMSGGV